MKPEMVFVALVMIVPVLLISGCTQAGPQCPTCPNPGIWSECDENAVKTRANYKCSEDTEYECESYTESQNCATEIRVTGNYGLGIVITPTVEDKVKGLMKLEAVGVPGDTSGIVLWAYAGSVTLEETNVENAVVTQHDLDESDGWEIFVETTELENGLYTLIITAANANDDGTRPWNDVVTTQIIVNN
jgi:hypothetical protein